MSTPRDPNHPDFRGIHAMQPLPDEQTPQTSAPREVTVSFWIWMVGGVLFAANVVLTLVVYRSQTTSLLVRSLQQSGSVGDSMTEAQLRDMANTALLIALVIMLLVVGLALFLTQRVRTGSARARAGLTAITAVVLLLALISVGGPAGLVGLLVPIVATALLYTPKASAYFRPRR